MQPRQRPPGAADRIEGATAQTRERARLGQGVARDALSLLGRTLGDVHQRKSAQRQRQPRPDRSADDVRQFQRAAAEIADHAVRFVDRRNDAHRRQTRLSSAAEHLDRRADRLLRECDELRAVGRVAHCRRRQRPHVDDFHHVAERAKAPQRHERLGDPVFGQKARGRDPAPQSAKHLFVERRRRRATQSLVGHQPHRVRADVDDRHRFSRQPSKGVHIAHLAALTLPPPSPFSTRRGEAARSASIRSATGRGRTGLEWS